MKINRLKKIINYSLRGVRFVNIENIESGKNIQIGRFSVLQTWPQKNKKAPKLTIKDNVYIGNFCQISCADEIVIGENTTLGDNVFICDNYHGNNSINEIEKHPLERELYIKGTIHIGKNVLVGRNVCILSNVKIGNNVIIGANSVVTHDFDDNVVIAGSPARIIRKINK